MTRYTFAILQCRVIGILSVLTLLDAWPMLANLISLVRIERAPALKWYEGIPAASSALALAIPLGGCLIGLCAKSAADRFRSPVEHIPKHFVSATVVAITWSIILARARQLGESDCFVWGNYGKADSHTFPDFLKMMADRSGFSAIGTSDEVWQLLATFTTLTLIVVLAMRPAAEPIEE